jgi:hypothetical protein
MATVTEMQRIKPSLAKTVRAKENRQTREKTWKRLPPGKTARSSERFRTTPLLPVLAKKGREVRESRAMHRK